MIRQFRPLFAAHFAGNAALLALAYYWLGIGESRLPALAWSALLAIATVGLACWLYGGAFAYFAEEKPRIRSAFASAARRLVPLLAVAALAAAIYWLLAEWAQYSSKPASGIASYLTYHLRKPVRPASVLRVFNAVLWVMRWAVVPVLLLPVVTGAAIRGWSGFRAVGALARRIPYWVEAPLLLLLALRAPGQLLDWKPRVAGFGLEVTSFTLRALAAYVLFITGLLLLAYFTSGRRARMLPARR